MNAGSLFMATIHGSWSSGWLYKDHLFLWNEDGCLFHAPVDAILDTVGRNYGADVGLASQLALFRNDWKNDLAARALVRSGRVADALRAVAEDAAAVGQIHINGEVLTPVDAEPIPGMILSVSVYGNHAFVGSSDGLFETNLNPRYLNKRSEVIQRMVHPVHDIDTNYGAVAVSAFEDGLWYDGIDFGEGASWLSGGPLRRLGEYSAGVSMASTNLLNFVDDSVPELYIGEIVRRRQTAMAAYESIVVTGYQRSSADLVGLTARRLGVEEARVREGEVRLLTNYKQQLLYEVSGALKVVRLKTFSEIELDMPRSLGANIEEVTAGAPLIATHPLGSGFLLESVNGVVLIGEDGATQITNRPTVSVQTFPVSRHFRDVAVIVEEERLLIAGLLDFP